MINQTYFHKMTVLRNQSTEDEWGGVISGYHEVTGLISIPCAFSQSSRNVNTSQTESTNEININTKNIYLGSFLTPVEAGIAYNNYIIENNLEGFILNEIPEEYINDKSLLKK